MYYPKMSAFSFHNQSCKGTFLRIKKYFCLKKEEKCFCPTKKLFLCFTQFSNLISWRRSFNVLSKDVCILFSYFCCSLVSVFKKWTIERILTLPYKWLKFNKMNEKRSQSYQSMSPEYVTWQINSHILQLLLRQFYCYAVVW